MLFTVLNVAPHIPTGRPNQAFLIRDNWNDWYEWYTMLTLVVIDSAGHAQTAGSVKIGQFGMKPKAQGQGKTILPQEFESLDESYFSLGQSEDYYQTIYKLNNPLRSQILSGLRDAAADLALFERALNEPVMQNSLLRSLSETRVRGKFNRLANGNASLTKFDFEYEYPKLDNTQIPLIKFEVIPESSPPTNIHVIIGRNGVGKTRLLQQMSLALLSEQGQTEELGTFRSLDTGLLASLRGAKPVANDTVFGNLVSVTFSAFDPFEPLESNNKEHPLALPYSYIGLKGSKVTLPVAVELLLKRPERRAESAGRSKNLGEVVLDFVDSAVKCRFSIKVERWRRALVSLETDPLFKEAAVTELASIEDESELRVSAEKLYKRLSSGHKIVLLTITRLVEFVEEKTLVLLDEPEAHLHPPLLSAFIRGLSDLLIQRNGVAIIATHSPVVLQEVPQKCAWILRRAGKEVRAERPEIETFGENVGILTREIFGLEVAKSGFHKMLEEAINSGLDYDAVLQKFHNQLGVEARAIIRGLVACRSNDSSPKA